MKEKTKSEGCFNCGNGKDKVLQSRTVLGVSVALCPVCNEFPPQVIAKFPYNMVHAQARAEERRG